MPGFPNYRVSDGGRVVGPRKELVPNASRDGHAVVHVYAGGQYGGRRVAVHTLVLEAFVGPRPEGMEARHLDDDVENNRLDNLAWAAPAEVRCRRRRGTALDGERNGRNKLTARKVAMLKRVLADRPPPETRKGKGRADLMSNAALAARLGVCTDTVKDIARGRIWRHVAPADLVVHLDDLGKAPPKASRVRRRP